MQIKCARFFGVILFSLSVYKTQNIITTEPNKQLQSGFLYIMPYSTYFAPIRKISVLPVHFPQKMYFKSCNARRATRKNWWFSWYAVPATRPGRVKKEGRKSWRWYNFLRGRILCSVTCCFLFWIEPQLYFS